jgi:hypothetical protein
VAPPAASNPYQAAGPTPPAAPPANPYYGQPAWNGMPQGPAPARGGISPTVIAVVGGLVIVALIIAGIAVVGLSRNNSTSTPTLQALITRTPTPTMAATGITFSPGSVDCSTPVDFVTTIRLPASVKTGDTITVKLDGQVLGTEPFSVGGSTTLQPDGSSLTVNTATASEMQADCENGGKSSTGVAVLTSGVHIYTILDASGTLLAEGSYMVTGVTPTPRPTPTSTPTLAPTPAPSVSSITFSPPNVSCAAPVDWTSTTDLPASVQSGDTVTEKLDGKTYATGAVGTATGWTQLTDGSWTKSATDTAADVAGVCATGGIYQGTEIFTSGTHSLQVFDASGILISEGTYTVGN